MKQSMTIERTGYIKVMYTGKENDTSAYYGEEWRKLGPASLATGLTLLCRSSVLGHSEPRDTKGCLIPVPLSTLLNYVTMHTRHRSRYSSKLPLCPLTSALQEPCIIDNGTRTQPEAPQVCLNNKAATLYEPNCERLCFCQREFQLGVLM